MAYNEYDDPHFFEEYAKMGRSQGGLPAAGEWHQLQPLFPLLEGKAVLDLGCGYGGTASMRWSGAQRRCWGSTSVTG